MDKIISGVIALIVSAVVLVFGLSIAPTKTIVQNTPSNPPYGAITGPEIPYPYLKWGGVTKYHYTETMQTGTTTLCAIQSPAATSTVTFADFLVTTGTTTAATIDIGLGSTAFATTSNLVAATSIGSSALGGASYGAPNGTAAVINPSTWVLVKTAGAGAGGYTYGGHCNVEFTLN